MFSPVKSALTCWQFSLHFIIWFVIFNLPMCFADLSGLTLSSSGRKVLLLFFFFSLSRKYTNSRAPSVFLTCCLSAGPLLVKDEYDYDNQQSHSSSDSHLQTIQHPPSRAGPPETFSNPSLLPPAEGSSAASTSAFSTISAGPSSKTQWKQAQRSCAFDLQKPSFIYLDCHHYINRLEPQLEQKQHLHPSSASTSEWTPAASPTDASHGALL